MFTVSGSEGTSSYKSRSGTLQGDKNSSEEFLTAFHPGLDEFHSDCSSDPNYSVLSIVDPISQVEVNVSTNTFADDMSHCTVADKNTCAYMRIYI